jgi:TRAP transporter 4TM/12TM fusion protein
MAAEPCGANPVMTKTVKAAEESEPGGLLGVLFSVGARRKPGGWLEAAITAYAAGFASWTIYAATIAIINPLALGAIFLSFAMVLVFMLLAPRSTSTIGYPGFIDTTLATASCACGLYFAINAEIISARISLLDPLSIWDITFGTLLWLLTMEATRRAVGLGLMIIVLGFVAYNLWGDNLGGVMSHGFISYEHFLDQTVFTTNGVFGAPIRVAATYAFLFVTFGTLLEKAKGGEFFFNLAASISGRSPGGPAKVAVFSSALYGTISGSPTSDVVTTGAITIPMMKKLGYPAALAGAVEVAASTSGGILPPVMGSAAFIMVEFTGIDYQTIALASIIPAALYCAGIYTRVHLMSLRLGLAAMEDHNIPKISDVLLNGGLFILPLVALVTALLMGYSITYVALFGIASILLVSSLKASTRLNLHDLYNVLATTTIRMVPVIAACAAAGLVIGGISMTGLSGKFGNLIFAVAGQEMFIALLVSGVIVILLGMGMPTPSAYIMAAVLAGPVLVDMGLNILPVHMFLLFYAVLSAITPPVAVAAYAASSIAEANPLSIAVKAVNIALPIFIIPFMFVYSPELLGQGSWVNILFSFTTAMAGIIALTIAIEGFLDGPLASWKRLCAATGGLMMMAPGLIAAMIGAVLCAPVILPWLIRFYETGRRSSDG